VSNKVEKRFETDIWMDDYSIFFLELKNSVNVCSNVTKRRAEKQESLYIVTAFVQLIYPARRLHE
jgi:hypothetical protein